MATKKKPTQLDRIEKMLKEQRTMLRRMDEKMNVCMNRADSIHTSLDVAYSKREEHWDWLMPKIIALLSSKEENSDQVKEEWVPKVGDCVVIIGEAPSGILRYPIGSIHRVGTRVNDGLVGIGKEDWGYQPKHLRPATPAELASYEQSLKDAEVTELQEGDACHTSMEEQAELFALAKKLGVPMNNWSTESNPGVQYIEGRLRSMMRKSEFENGGGPNRNFLAFDVIEKRLRNTAARLKKEAAEQEMKRVPEFGMRVRFTINGEPKEGLYLGKFDGVRHRLWAEGGDALSYRDRSQFTIIDQPL